MRTATKMRSKDIERRQSRRLAVLWSGRLAGHDREVGCVLLNVSAHGAMLRFNQPLEQQDSITLRSQRFGDIVGEVVWRHNDHAGLRLMMPARLVARLFKGTLPDFHLA